MKKNIITAIIILINFSVQSQNWWNSKKVNGNGNIITKTRTIGSFKKIIVGGSFDVLLVDGKESSVTIKSDENIIPYIVTEIKGNTLNVNFKKNTNIKTTKGITIIIPFEEISEVSLSGSGSITSEKTIKTNSFSLNLSGSGNVKGLEINTSSLKSTITGSGNISLKGTTEKLISSISGSGNLNAYNLIVDELQSNTSGSGNLKTTVNTKINANIVGSGSIYYKGTAKYIDSNIVGSGDIIDKN